MRSSTGFSSRRLGSHSLTPLNNTWILKEDHDNTIICTGSGPNKVNASLDLFELM